MCWFPTSRRRKLPCLCVANSLKGKAKVVKVAASGLFLSIVSCKGLGTLGTSIMKEHQPGEEVSRKMGACSKGVGSKSEPFWLKLSRIAQNQGSSQLGRWDTTKGPVFLLWHLSFPPWKLWVVSDWCCPWKPSMTLTDSAWHCVIQSGHCAVLHVPRDLELSHC